MAAKAIPKAKIRPDIHVRWKVIEFGLWSVQVLIEEKNFLYLTREY